jgi:hypothetical protein
MQAKIPSTEAEWLTCGEPSLMCLALSGYGNIPPLHSGSDRKRRLYHVASCRRGWDLLAAEELCRKAVEVAERFADGEATAEELKAAHAAAYASCEDAFDDFTFDERRGSAIAFAVQAAVYTADPEVIRWSIPAWCARAHANPGREHGEQAWNAICNVEWKVECGLIRDVFGNPFRPACVAPTWLRWNDGTVHKIAQDIYDKAHFENLPILGNALLDAGCDDETILTHCREPGSHIRGCWVVDLLLGKK